MVVMATNCNAAAVRAVRAMGVCVDMRRSIARGGLQRLASLGPVHEPFALSLHQRSARLRQAQPERCVMFEGAEPFISPSSGQGQFSNSARRVVIHVASGPDTPDSAALSPAWMRRRISASEGACTW